MPSAEYFRHVQLLFQDPYSFFNPIYKVQLGFDSVFKWSNSVNEQSKFPHKISGGQLSRAALTRALLVEPDLLSVEEPTSMTLPFGLPYSIY